MSRAAPIPSHPPAGQTTPAPVVFLSYSRRDRSFVERLHRALAEHGVETWVDWEDIPATATWRERIGEGIDGASAFVFVLSPDSIASVECDAELDLALAANKRIVPILHREVDTAGVRTELERVNWLPFLEQDDFERAVESLVAAVETDLAWLDTHARLLKRAREWEAGRRDRSLLLRGSDLASAETWLQSQTGHAEAATPLQIDFVVASRRESSRRQRIAIGAVTIALLVSLALAALAFVLRGQSIQREHEARSRELAGKALTQLAIDPELGLLLAREAARASETAEAANALRRALIASHLSGQVSLGMRPSWAQFSAGGSHVVFERENTIYDWSFETHKRTVTGRADDGKVGMVGKRELRLTPGDRIVITDPGGRHADIELPGRYPGVITISARGDYVVVNGSHGDIEARSIPDGTLLGTAPGLLGDSGDIATARDGSALAVLREANPGQPLEAYLWRAPWRTRIRMPIWRHADFSPDGTLLATTDASGCGITLRDAQTGRPVRSLRDRGTCLQSSLFANARPLVATVETNGNIAIWSSASGRLLQTMAAGGANPLAFSPDDRLLLADDTDEADSVWDVRNGERLALLVGNPRVVVDDLEFVRGEPATLRSVSADGKVRSWAIPVPLAAGRVPRGLDDVAFAPAGLVALGTPESWFGRSVTAWSIRYRRSILEARPTARFPAFEGDIVAGGAFLVSRRSGIVLLDRLGRVERRAPIGEWFLSPDRKEVAYLRGRRLMVRSLPDWSVVGDRNGAPLAPRERPILLGPAGRIVLVTKGSGGPIVRDLARGTGVRLGNEEAGAAAFDATADRVAVAGGDGNLAVFDSATGERLTDLVGRGALWDSVAFDRSGSILLATARDGTVHLWDASSGEQLMLLRPGRRPPVSLEARFDETGSRFAVWSPDGGIWVYACDVCRDMKGLEQLAIEHSVRELTSFERREFLN